MRNKPNTKLQALVLAPVVTTNIEILNLMEKKVETTQGSGTIINSTDFDNSLNIKLVNPGKSITIAEGAVFQLIIPIGANAIPYTITTQEGSFTLSAKVSTNNSSTGWLPTTPSNSLSIKANRDITLNTGDYIELKVGGIKTNFSSKNSFFVIKYNKLTGFINGNITIPVSIQSMVMDHQSIIFPRKKTGTNTDVVYYNVMSAIGNMQYSIYKRLKATFISAVGFEGTGGGISLFNENGYLTVQVSNLPEVKEDNYLVPMNDTSPSQNPTTSILPDCGSLAVFNYPQAPNGNNNKWKPEGVFQSSSNNNGGMLNFGTLETLSDRAPAVTNKYGKLTLMSTIQSTKYSTAIITFGGGSGLETKNEPKLEVPFLPCFSQPLTDLAKMDNFLGSPQKPNLIMSEIIHLPQASLQGIPSAPFVYSTASTVPTYHDSPVKSRFQASLRFYGRRIQFNQSR